MDNIFDLESYHRVYGDHCGFPPDLCFHIVPDCGHARQLHPAIKRLEHQAPTDVKILHHFWDDEGINAFISMNFDGDATTYLIGVWWADGMSWLHQLIKCINDRYQSVRMYQKYTGNGVE